MPEKPLLCLGEAWLELTADTPPELAGQFQIQVGGQFQPCLLYTSPSPRDTR